MSSFEVIGGNKLKGEIIPQGAKNEALQILSAVLLTRSRLPFQIFPTSSMLTC
jgi:UDP-N-acetylglucosamine 1-carboxyvinyltransferase